MAFLRCCISRVSRSCGELVGKCSTPCRAPPPRPPIPFNGDQRWWRCAGHPLYSPSHSHHHLGAAAANFSEAVPLQQAGESSWVPAPWSEQLHASVGRDLSGCRRGSTEVIVKARGGGGYRVSQPERDGIGGLMLEARSTDGSGDGTIGLLLPPRRAAMDLTSVTGAGHGSAQGAAERSQGTDGYGHFSHASSPADFFAARLGGSPRWLPRLAELFRQQRHHHNPAHRLQAIRAPIPSHLYQTRRWMSSGREAGDAPPPPPPRRGSYWKHRGTILKRPTFLPAHLPDLQAALKNWRLTENVPGIVYEHCVDATSLLVKIDPVQYLKDHPIMEVAPVLGEPVGTIVWKFTEDGKYTCKILIDLIGAFHDIGCCIPTLSVDSVVINSSGKFELIEAKTKFTALTREGVDMDYRRAASLLEELIVASMGRCALERISEDIKILFKYMKTDGYECRYLIGTHVSLLPLQTRSAVYMAFFEYITLPFPNGDTKLKRDVRQLIPYRKLWAIIASNNSYLVEWLRYQDDNTGKKFWGSCYQLLQIVRNVEAHRLVLLTKGKIYEADEVAIMLYALFPKLLPEMQYILFKRKCLRRFNLEVYFMDRKITQGWPPKRSFSD